MPVSTAKEWNALLRDRRSARTPKPESAAGGCLLDPIPTAEALLSCGRAPCESSGRHSAESACAGERPKALDIDRTIAFDHLRMFVHSHTAADPQFSALVESASILVGLHPDSAAGPTPPPPYCGSLDAARIGCIRGGARS